MSLQKAYFVNLENENKIESLDVQYNPTDLVFNKTAQFAEIAIPGLDQPVLQFIRGGTETLTIKLFFDTTDEGMGEGAKSVTKLTDKFYQLVKQDRKKHAPPRCRFSWGAIDKESKPAQGEALGPLGKDKEVSKAPCWFTGIVESVDREFLLFSPEGIPLRARLTVKMREYKTVEQMISKLESADHTKARIIKRRERLDQVSANEYDTPTEWRRIADENDIDDPRRVPPGAILKVPPMIIESATRRSR